MKKLGFLTLVFLFLIGLGVSTSALYAQDTSGWGDDDDDSGWGDDDDDSGWGDDDDDDDDAEKLRKLEQSAYAKALRGTIADCEEYLKYYENTGTTVHIETVKARLAKLEKEAAEAENENKYAGMTPEEIKRAKDKEREEAKRKALYGDGDGTDTTGTDDTTGKTTVRKFGSPLSQQEIEYLWSGASFWTVQMFNQAHFGLIFSQTDWKGEITDGHGSNIVINAGIEYDISEMFDMPMTAFGDLGLRISNKNPWDTDGFAVTTWLGAKYLIQDLDSRARSGLMYAAAFSLGIGLGAGDHEANVSMWTGHMNPPVFLLTPMLTGIVSYKLDSSQYINGTLGFMFFLGTEEDGEAYPIEQDSMFAIEASAEYYRPFEIFMRKFGVHGGISFRSSYDPLFSIYAKLNSLLGPYMQMVIPFTSDTASVSFMFMVGYSLPMFDFVYEKKEEIAEPVKDDTTEPVEGTTPEEGSEWGN